MWHSQVEAPQDTYHCLIPDLPEHGLSAAVQPFTIEDAAHRIAELIREKGHGGRAHVIGLSEGAQIGVQLLASAPEVVDHAIISSALMHPVPGIGLLGPRAFALIFHLFAAPLVIGLNLRTLFELEAPPCSNIEPKKFGVKVRHDFHMLAHFLIIGHSQ